MNHTEKLSMSDPSTPENNRKEVLEAVEEVRKTFRPFALACQKLSKLISFKEREIMGRVMPFNGEPCTEVSSLGFVQWINSQWPRIDRLILRNKEGGVRRQARKDLLAKLALSDEQLRLLGVKRPK